MVITQCTKKGVSQALNIFIKYWSYNDFRAVERFYTAWRKTIRRIWRIDKRTHNLLIHAINNCLPISLLLEKRCIKFIWNLFNSPYAIHKSVVNGSFHNKGSTISENIRYFMYKYDINMYDWGKPLNIVMEKVYAYDKLHTDVDIQCMQMPLSIYVKTETIIDMMYLQVLILMISYNFSVPINYRYYL